ncbi:MAG: cyanophycinase, partial [Sandaracinobacteroides sp.]
APSVQAAPGKLVIVGGGLSASNAAVHRAFLSARPAGRPQVAIIPSASGTPADAGRRFAEALIRHGARAEDLVVVHLASEDDPDSRDVDESRWAGNAANPDEIAKIMGAGAIWFTGGDQLRTTRLLNPGGRETAMLQAIRARLANGAVLGGSSAGAAIMSRPMITEGEPLASLLEPVQRQAEPDNRRPGGPLVMAEGLGFLPRGLVDQHFNARHRLGRLARALFELPPDERIGFGIDEDTALVIDLARGRATVAGTDSVTILDARAARRLQGERFGADAILLSSAASGDSIELQSLEVTPAPARRPITPAADAPPVPDASGGMAVPEQAVSQLLADALFANPARTSLDRPSLRGTDGVGFRFTRTPQSRGFAGGGTTLSGLQFDIRPLTFSSTEASR